MSSQEIEARSLEELDAEDRQELERVQDIVLRVVDEQHPATISQLSAQVRERLGEVDNAVIRAAILRLLNADRLHIGNGQHVAAAR
jgi:NAD(P)-dependent dehydrogenase (short-subunit alcohol dehydrogenase family)